MKLLPYFLIAAVSLVVTGCQNMKESELVIINSSDSDITLHFNGTRFNVAAADSASQTGNLLNTADFRPDNYNYTTVYTIPAAVNAADDYTVNAGSGLSGNFDFTTRGTRISIEYASDTKTTVTYDTTWNEPADSTQQKTVASITAKTKTEYKIGATLSEGYTD